jgi:hypothetical protein
LSTDTLFLPILVLVSVLVQVRRRVHVRLRYRAPLALAPVVLALLGGALLTLGSQFDALHTTALAQSVPTASVTTPAALHSLLLTGNAAAEAAANPDLNLTREWTVETWFKDEAVTPDPKPDLTTEVTTNSGDRWPNVGVCTERRANLEGLSEALADSNQDDRCC